MKSLGKLKHLEVRHAFLLNELSVLDELFRKVGFEGGIVSAKEAAELMRTTKKEARHEDQKT